MMDELAWLCTTDTGFRCLLHIFGPGFLRVDLRADTPFISCGISFHINSICK